MIKEYLYLMRKKRSDRNHLIYKITCLPTLDEYIGVTVMNSTSVKKAMKTRWKQHCYKAQVVSPDWSLSESIREHGEDMFLIEPLEIVRGRMQAFDREAELINTVIPSLNTKKKTTGE